MIHRARLLLPALGLALVTGCGPIGPSTPGTPGELGNGQFSYACDSDSDPVCDTGDGAHTMPKSVAVGGRFSATYTPSATQENNQGSASVTPASEALLVETESFSSSFKAVKPGLGALLARRGNTVIDLVHLRIKTVDHIQIDASGSGGEDLQEGIAELALGEGETATIRARAVDEADETLAGALKCGWSASPEGIIDFTTLATDNQIQITGKASGTTTLHLEMGDSTADLALTIGTGGPGGAGGGGAGGAGASGGAGGGGGMQ